MTDAIGSTTWNYNSQGLPSTETDPFGEVIGYEYDALGRKTDLTLNSSLATHYSYDPLNRISTVSTPDNEYEYSYYYLTQQVESINRNNTEVVKNDFDILNRLTSKTNKNLNGDIISKYDYTLNNADLRVKIDTTKDTKNTKEFAYNLVNELTSAKKYTIDNGIKTFDVNYKYSYSYDPMGNRISANLTDTPLSYESNDLNQYTNIFNPNGTADELLYNANGSLTGLNQSTSYSYNDENRLTTVISHDSEIINIYDALGRRRIKQVYDLDKILQSETQYTYDGWKLIKEVSLNQQSEVIDQKLYYWGVEKLLETSHIIQDVSNVYFAFEDGNENITSYTDTDGNTVAKYEYSPFGSLIKSNGGMADEFTFRFSSQYFDTETGLVYYGLRFYSPELGRWLSRDPIAELGGLNLYAFCSNNPINFTDILGMCEDDWWGDFFDALWNDYWSCDMNARACRAAQAMTDILIGAGEMAFGMGTAPLGGAYLATDGLSRIAGGATKYANIFGAGLSSGDFVGNSFNDSLGDYWGPVVRDTTALVVGGLSSAPNKTINTSKTTSTSKVNNPVPDEIARVVPGKGPYPTLGHPTTKDVFVTAADDITNLNASQVAKKLTIPQNDTFTVIKFKTPKTGLATPINRNNPGFIGGGRTAGGAREFVIPNQKVPSNSNVEIIK